MLTRSLSLFDRSLNLFQNAVIVGETDNVGSTDCDCQYQWWPDEEGRQATTTTLSSFFSHQL
jgi:hypothetical protein